MQVSLGLSFLLWLDVAGRVLGGSLRSQSNSVAHSSSSTYRRRKSGEGPSLGRNLDYDPNDKLKRFVSSAVLKVPDLEAEQETLAGPLYLNVTDFRCFDVTFGEVNLNMVEERRIWRAEESNQFQLEVTDLYFKCKLGISWAYGWLDGAGNVSVNSDSNYLSAVMSTEAATRASRGKKEKTCKDTEIDIDTLEFDGDMSMRVLTLYRGFIRRIAESKVEEIFCDLMSQEMLGLALNKTQEKIEQFSVDLPPWRTDPLFKEGSIVVPDDGSIVNLQNDPLMGDFMNLAIKNLNSIYGARKYDPTAPTPDQMDYGINTMMRDKLLDENRIFSYDEAAGEQKTTSTPLVDINVTIRSIKIHGLDTATVVTPIEFIGDYTIQNKLRWDALTLDVDSIVTVSANAGETSFLENGAQMEPIVESFTYIQHLSGLEVLASFYVPLQRSEVEALPMGYILNWESLPGCIPPVLFGMEVSGLDMSMGDIQEPILQGIESQDIDEIARSSVQIGLATFEDEIIRVIPAFVQTEVRDALADLMWQRRCPVVGRKLSEEIPIQPRRELTEVEDPVRRGLSEEEEFVRPEGEALYFNLGGAFVCVCSAALAAGLTMGLLSLDELMLLIKERAGTEQDKKAARRLLPIIRQHHLLLVSLLLMNALANEALPLFLDKIVPGFAAVIISVTLVLLFGEIIPTALFTGPDQVNLASRFAPLVRLLMFIFSPISWPIAKILDRVLHEAGEGYNRTELSALVRIQYESHLVDKRQRKNQISNALKEFESTESLDSYASRRSSGARVHPEIKNTLRIMKKQISQGQLHASDDLHIDEVAMVEGALQMGTTEAIDVYTPWKRVFTLPNDMVLTERNTVKIYRSGFSRIPIFEKNPDDPEDTTRIVGMLVSKQLIVIDSVDEREVATLPLAIPRCVSPHTTLVDLVNIFQSGGVRGSHMALVCGRPELGAEALKKHQPLPEEASLMGVVTLEDVLENLIQEQIYDEFDRKEKKRLQLARWGVQRWKMFVKKRKKQRGEAIPSGYDSFSEARLANVVEEAMKHEEEHASESTSLLEKPKKKGFFGLF